MADNAFVKIGTVLLKHQVKKLVGEEALGAIGEELAEIGGDKLDTWLGDKSTIDEVEKAAKNAEVCFHDLVGNHELEQWMVSLPIGDLPKVLEAIEKLPTSPDEKELESEIRNAVAGWRELSDEQIKLAVNSFMSCLRSALLPIEKQTLMVIGRSVLRTEDKVNQLLKLVENLKAERQPSKQGKKRLNTGWYFGHRYGDIETFTGRTQELQMLSDWLDNKKDNLLIIRALGGFGKSALTWQWFNNNVDKVKWHTAVWWSFYEKESGFESFLIEALTHLGLETKDRSSRQQVNDLLNAMHKTNILIALDGFERLLRQYGKMDAALQSDDEDADIDPSQRDCSSPLTETFLRGLSGADMRSKVLMTTRLCPRVLESADGKLLKGCRDEPLQAFSPDDAVTYFHNEGIAATRAEIIEFCSAYGYHPLSLNLLVGLINKDHEHKGDIIVARNLDIFGDIKAKRHHVLKYAYESLLPERRELLSKISCFRGSMEYATIKKVFDSPDLEKSLIDLRERGLLQYIDKTKRYDMHPIVRHYAYERLTAPNRTTAHNRLRDYFAAVDIPENPQTLDDLAPIVEHYYHTARAEQYGQAKEIFRKQLDVLLNFRFGAHQMRIELLRELYPDGDNRPPRLKKESDQSWTLNALANSYGLSGQPRRALPLFKASNVLDEKRGNRDGVAIGLGNLAYQQIRLGELTAAERNLQNSIELFCQSKRLSKNLPTDSKTSRKSQIQGEVQRGSKDEWRKAIIDLDLGRILAYRGAFDAAEIVLKTVQEVFDIQGAANTNFVSVVRGYRALRALLMQDVQAALELSQQARTLADVKHNERDIIRAEWLLGTVLVMAVETENTRELKDYRTLDDVLNHAEVHITDAITRCRRISMVDYDPDLFLTLARWHRLRGNAREAQSHAEEALEIANRNEYRLQQADIRNFLAHLALDTDNRAMARQHAEIAKERAWCDGPPYYYKVAYEEAERMLASLNV